MAIVQPTSRLVGTVIRGSKIVFLIALVAQLFSAEVARTQNTTLLGSARTAILQSDVVFNRDRKFHSNAIPLSYIYKSGLFKSFHEVSANPDIIIKFHKDVFLIDEEKLSLIVFDAEDNSVIFTEERPLVDEQNDVNRLVSHFLAKVSSEGQP